MDETTAAPGVAVPLRKDRTTVSVEVDDDDTSEVSDDSESDLPSAPVLRPRPGNPVVFPAPPPRPIPQPIQVPINVPHSPVRPVIFGGDEPPQSPDPHVGGDSDSDHDPPDDVPGPLLDLFPAVQAEGLLAGEPDGLDGADVAGNDPDIEEWPDMDVPDSPTPRRSLRPRRKPTWLSSDTYHLSQLSLGPEQRASIVKDMLRFILDVPDDA